MWKEIVKNPKIHFISRSDWDKISIEQILTWFDSKKFWESPVFNWVRAYTNLDYWFEYLKIAEWCNNHCTFCIIPRIRWKQKSLPMADVVQQAQELLNSWVKEIILLAQDTNRYWVDLYGKSMLFELLEKLEEIDWDFVYRVLYLYPDILTLKHLEKLQKLKKFVPYFDIPLQHINPEILRRMWRFYDKNHILNLLDYIDKNFEEKFVRTNIIVWFPWETEKEFDELCDFLKSYHFDNIALFEYHDEPLAESSKLDWKVDEKEIHRRFEILKWIINENMSSWALAKDINLDSSLRSEWQWKSSKWNENIWYIMWFEWNENNPTIIVRPRLHAPEIDEYDQIKLKNIKWIFWNSEELDIWSKIQYKK
jgi:ribosomal protein S12 methylthiotransferase